MPLASDSDIFYDEDLGGYRDASESVFAPTEVYDYVVQMEDLYASETDDLEIETSLFASFVPSNSDTTYTNCVLYTVKFGSSEHEFIASSDYDISVVDGALYNYGSQTVRMIRKGDEFAMYPLYLCLEPSSSVSYNHNGYRSYLRQYYGGSSYNQYQDTYGRAVCLSVEDYRSGQAFDTHAIYLLLFAVSVAFLLRGGIFYGRRFSE